MYIYLNVDDVFIYLTSSLQAGFDTRSIFKQSKPGLNRIFFLLV